MRYDVLRSSTSASLIIWDKEKEDFIRNPNTSIKEFEDETQAQIYIEKLERKK